MSPVKYITARQHKALDKTLEILRGAGFTAIYLAVRSDAATIPTVCLYGDVERLKKPKGKGGK